MRTCGTTPCHNDPRCWTCRPHNGFLFPKRSEFLTDVSTRRTTPFSRQDRTLRHWSACSATPRPVPSTQVQTACARATRRCVIVTLAAGHVGRTTCSCLRNAAKPYLREHTAGHTSAHADQNAESPARLQCDFPASIDSTGTDNKRTCSATPSQSDYRRYARRPHNALLSPERSGVPTDAGKRRIAQMHVQGRTLNPRVAYSAIARPVPLTQAQTTRARATRHRATVTLAVRHVGCITRSCSRNAADSLLTQAYGGSHKCTGRAERRVSVSPLVHLLG